MPVDDCFDVYRLLADMAVTGDAPRDDHHHRGSSSGGGGGGGDLQGGLPRISEGRPATPTTTTSYGLVGSSSSSEMTSPEAAAAATAASVGAAVDRSPTATAAAAVGDGRLLTIFLAGDSAGGTLVS